MYTYRQTLDWVCLLLYTMEVYVMSNRMTNKVEINVDFIKSYMKSHKRHVTNDLDKRLKVNAKTIYRWFEDEQMPADMIDILFAVANETYTKIYTGMPSGNLYIDQCFDTNVFEIKCDTFEDACDYFRKATGYKGTLFKTNKAAIIDSAEKLMRERGVEFENGVENRKSMEDFLSSLIFLYDTLHRQLKKKEKDGHINNSSIVSYMTEISKQIRVMGEYLDYIVFNNERDDKEVVKLYCYYV